MPKFKPKKQSKKSTPKARKKIAAPKKKTAHPDAQLYKWANTELHSILVAILQNETLRDLAEVSLEGKEEISLELDINFIGAKEMQALNRKHRGKDQPTDILSFPAHGVFRAQGHLGDIVICRSLLKFQAKDHGHNVKEELRVLLVHGTLHLLGMDHEKSPAAAKKMAAWEKKLLVLADESAPAGLISRAGMA